MKRISSEILTYSKSGYFGPRRETNIEEDTGTRGCLDKKDKHLELCVTYETSWLTSLPTPKGSIPLLESRSPYLRVVLTYNRTLTDNSRGVKTFKTFITILLIKMCLPKLIKNETVKKVWWFLTIKFFMCDKLMGKTL